VESASCFSANLPLLVCCGRGDVSEVLISSGLYCAVIVLLIVLSMKIASAEDFYRDSQEGIVVDVRSPAEFAAGHMPHATNIALFSDEERAAVGTLYAKSGREDAIEKGLEFVGPKMAGFVRQAKDLLATSRCPNAPIFIHCWRGGMRSQSFAWLLETAGMNVQVLNGGYKAYRKIAHRKIAFRHQMIVLSGLTGAGKTEYLEMLQDAGEQIVDRLFAAIEKLDPRKRVWVEDEGSRLGQVTVPSRFVKQIRRAPAVFLDVPKVRRLDNLLKEYGDLDREDLIEATRGIQKRLGGMSALPRETTVNLSTEGLDDGVVVQELIKAADEINSDILAVSKLHD